MKNTFLILIISLFLSGCIALSGLKANYPVGQEYNNLINVAGKEVPLPPGNWKTIGSGYVKDRDQYFEVYLLNVNESNKIAGVITIVTETVFNNYVGYLKNEYCERTDVHYTKVTSNPSVTRLGNEGIDCLAINHIRMSLTPDSTARKEAFEYIRSKNYVLPRNMIQSYHNFTGDVIKNAYLLVKHYVNPEIDGFEPPKEASWSSSDWHPLQIGNDPKKVSYLKDFQTKSELYHAQLRDKFDH